MITRAIQTFKTGDYSVTRDALGVRAQGAYVAGTPTTTTGVAMAIQPIEGRDLRVLPEGSTATDYRLVLTEFALHENDVIAYQGEDWTVYRAQDWALRGATWTRAYISRDTRAVRG